MAKRWNTVRITVPSQQTAAMQPAEVNQGQDHASKL